LSACPRASSAEAAKKSKQPPPPPPQRGNRAFGGFNPTADDFSGGVAEKPAAGCALLIPGSGKPNQVCTCSSALVKLKRAHTVTGMLKRQEDYSGLLDHCHKLNTLSIIFGYKLLNFSEDKLLINTVINTKHNFPNILDTLRRNVQKMAQKIVLTSNINNSHNVHLFAPMH
jgi:hypothetical protein